MVTMTACPVITIREKGIELPPTGESARIVWQDEFADKYDPESYQLVGRLEKETTWCFATKAIVDEQSHDEMAEKAGELGGDILVLECGKIGTYRECECQGRVLKTVAGELEETAKPPRTCVPGTTQLCVGPGGCQGGQACQADGRGFEPCDCGAKPDER